MKRVPFQSSFFYLIGQRETKWRSKDSARISVHGFSFSPRSAFHPLVLYGSQRVVESVEINKIQKRETPDK